MLRFRPTVLPDSGFEESYPSERHSGRSLSLKRLVQAGCTQVYASFSVAHKLAVFSSGEKTTPAVWKEITCLLTHTSLCGIKPEDKFDLLNITVRMKDVSFVFMLS